MKVCNELKKALDNSTSLARIKKADEECLARLRVKHNTWGSIGGKAQEPW